MSIFFRSRALPVACCLLVALCGVDAARAGSQFLVTAANSVGNAVYDLTEAVNSPLISGATKINTDGAAHGSFDSLVWVPNAATGSLDLIVADGVKGQILRYAGPSYGIATVLYTHTKSLAGPSKPSALSVDAAGNVYVASSSEPFESSSSLWVLPVNANGTYGAPLLIDQTYGGQRTFNIAETLVATTTTPLWNTGDLLVLINDSFDARVVVYSAKSLASVLSPPHNALRGPTSTAISFAQFYKDLAVPVGMAEWPADANHGISLLIPTFDGRIERFDTHTGAFAGHFASGLGLGLQKIKTGIYSNTPYAFVTRTAGFGGGAILEFGAPPANGSNTPLATLSKSVSAPQGLAVTGTDSQPPSACENATCNLLGNGLTLNIATQNSPQFTGSIVAQTCNVPADPRVSFTGSPSNATWTCNGRASLDVANYCPGFPSTILPGSLCGHAGPSGSGFVVIKSTAAGVDPVDNNAIIQATSAINILLPGPLDLNCATPLGAFAWAPRSDLPGIEGTIPESPNFLELTGLCDNSGVNERGVSMFALGVALNTATSALPDGLPGYVNTKYTNLDSTVMAANIASLTKSKLQSCIATSQAYFTSGVGAHGALNGFSCAAYQLTQCDAYVRSNLNSFSSNLGPTGGNPNPAGDIDGRLANLYLTINTRVAGNPVNSSWPANNIPSCITIGASKSTVTAGTATTLSWSAGGVPAGSQCLLSSSDGHFTNTSVAPSGSASTGSLTIVGANAYTYTLECPGSGGSSSLASATVSVTAAPPPTPAITSFTVSPTSVPAGPTSTTTLSWTTSNETSGAACTITQPGGSSISNLPVNGSTSSLAGALTTPSTTTFSNTFTLACTGATSQTTTVNVQPAPPPPPAITSFTASPTSVTAGSASTTTLSWTTTNETSGAVCAITQPDGTSITGLPVSGSTSSLAGALTTASTTAFSNTFTLACTGATSQTTTVNVQPAPPPVITSLTANTSSIAAGGSALLSWVATGVPSGSNCSLSANDGTFVATPNTPEPANATAVSTGPLGAVPQTFGYNEMYQVTLSCSNTAGGIAMQTLSIPVLTNVPLNQPSALVYSTVTRSLYVANRGTSQILVYTLGGAGQLVQEPSSTITVTSASTLAPNLLALALDAAGNLYVSDGNNGVVLVYGVASLAAPNPVPIAGATITLPSNFSASRLAVDKNGIVYAAENIEIGVIATYSYPTGLANGPTQLASVTADTTGYWSSIGAIGFDGTNIVAAINYGSGYQLSVFSPSSLTTASTPTPLQVTPYANLSPSGIAFDAGNHIYVSDFNGNVVTEYTPSTAAISQIGTFALTAIPTTGVALGAAAGIAIDSGGTIYVSDSANNTVDAYSGASANAGTFLYQFLPIVSVSFAADGLSFNWVSYPYFASEYSPSPASDPCLLTTQDNSSPIVTGTTPASANGSSSTQVLSATLSCPGAIATAFNPLSVE